MSRTTVRLNESVLRQAKRHAADHGLTLTALIEQSLRSQLTTPRHPSVQEQPLVLPSFGGNGLRPGVDLDSSAGLLDVMEGR